jgi:hypothetical protein
MNNSPASRLLPVVVGGVLSFGVGLYMLSVSKIVAPSEGAGKIDPPPKKDFPPPPNVDSLLKKGTRLLVQRQEESRAT